jgi:hypothetical protein
MTLGEVLFRTWRTLSNKVEKYRLSYGWQPAPKQVVSSQINLFGTNPLLVSQWENFFQLDNARLEQYLDGKIDFFGHEKLSTGMPVSWHCDPVTGIQSPMEFGKELNYRDDRIVGNVKFLWELGRHQHLVPLIIGYIGNNDIRYRDNVVEQINSWISSNPYGYGIHWCSSLEASLRMISWALVHSFLVLKDGGKGLFDVVAEPLEFGKSIYQHCYFIRHFLSLHSSANNHLIGELTGLWVACKVFDLGGTGHQWAEFSQQELESESVAQVYVDGVNKEQAFYYHMWVLEYLLFARLVASRADKEFSSEFDKKLHLMYTFLKNVSTKDGEPPQIGDADDGFVSRFDPHWSQAPYAEIIGTVEAIFGCSEDKDKVKSSQKAFWYSAIAANSLQGEIKNFERNYPMAFKEGGYAILGGSDCHIVMDAGDLGYLGIAAHGHADALSFCMAIDNEWWLVDPGTYAYHSGTKWRNYFRSSSAHNTVVINNLDQSTIAGAFMWTHKAHGELLSVDLQEEEQIAIGKHDGYNELGVKHQRSISFNTKMNKIQVIDKLMGGKDVEVDIYFHFSPKIAVIKEESTGHWIASHPDSKKYLVFKLDKKWEVALFNGQDTPALGWYSPSLEVKVPTNTLRGTSMYSNEFHSTISIQIINPE